MKILWSAVTTRDGFARAFTVVSILFELAER